MKYRREIDGLRAIAVIPVILFHGGFKAFEGGFVGVDVFFVISGYLITSIILSDMNKEKFSIVTFYERRSRRILPALFFVMLCSLPFAWLWLTPNHLKDFSQSLIAIAVFSSNILFLMEAGYFGTASELKPMLHIWSLSVEEQYYILFPLFLMALWKLRKRWIFASLMVVAIVSLALAQWGAYNEAYATFFLLPTRGWELAIGGFIALYLLYKEEQYKFITSNKATCEFLSLLGLTLVFYSIFAFSKSTPFPSLYALIPTIGAALIILFATSDTISGRLLSTEAMVSIGLISYSIYLWHQPLFAFARHRSLSEPSTALLLALSVLSIVLAYFSWRYVEMPFRDKKAIDRNKIFSFAIIGSVIFAATGLAGHMNNGFDKRFNDNGISLADIRNKTIINIGLSSDCETGFTLSPNCRTSDEPEILVWGDSYAMHLVQGIMASNPQAKIIQMTMSVCGPFFGVAPVNANYPVSWAKECLEFNKKVHDWLHKNKTIKYAVLSSPFAQYIGNDQLLIGDNLFDAGNEFAMEHFLATLKEIKNMGISPIVFSPTPQNGKNIGECLSKADFFGEDLNSCSFNRDDIADYSMGVFAFLKKKKKSNKVIFLNK
ncbi:MAG: acyltransferase, partial [Magnetococcales bacterium]|nr:acyltransferase [Magnetococcales bacterium]